MEVQKNINPKGGRGLGSDPHRNRPDDRSGERMDGGSISRFCATRPDATTGVETAESIPRFLLVKSTEDGMENFDKMNPFLITRSMYGLIGETRLIRKVKDGLLVQTKTEKQTKKLLETTTFAGKGVTVEPHGQLNTSKGVIYCKDFLNCTIEEILEEVRHIGVTQVRRLKTKKDGVLVDTPSHVLTFNTPNLPTKIRAAFYSFNVRPFMSTIWTCC
uniref:Uncharacterized protein n=1 Tax=Photinus pyralis TaxID=7054 RepID=A0A1Y1LB18_PHOPY